jgi:hypothetical protein
MMAVFSLPITDLAVRELPRFYSFLRGFRSALRANQREQSQISQYGACLAMTN